MNKISNWFSNFIPFDKPIEINNIFFQTPEHLYQSLKATNFDDVQKIANCESPGRSKRAGGKIKIRSDWDEIKLKVMKFVIDKQFTKESSQGHKLILFKHSIIEINYWHDNYWGDCVCKKCKNIIGQNHLGKILEIRRRELIEGN
jgi:ribA/ribD-fused uncharacterized protein